MASEHTTDANDATFDAEVLAADVPVLVDFWATWCAPCRQIAPHLDKLAEELDGSLKVVKLDAQTNMATAKKFNVTGLPTFLVFLNGKEVERKIGVGGGPTAIRKLVEPYLA